MSERLIIRLGDDPARSWWFAMDAQGNRIGTPGEGAPEQAAKLTERRQVIVLVPGETVSLHTAQMPTRNTQKALQALPYALEDKLAEDIDELHFALGGRDGDRLDAAVVRRERMDEWLAVLKDAGIVADVLLPDFMGLPAPADPDSWVAAYDDDRYLVRQASARGFVLAAPLLPVALRDAAPAAVRLYGDTATDAVAAPFTQRGIEIEPAGELLDAFTAGLDRAPAFNLLQGAYQPKRDQRIAWRRWRWPAVAAAIWLVLALGTWISTYVSLSLEQQRLREAMVATVRDAFPGATVTNDPRGLLTSRLMSLKQQGGESGFLDIFSAVGEAAAQQPGLTLQAVSYRDGRLDISVNADTVQTLDALKTALNSDSRWHAEVQAANNKGDHVEGRLQIKTEGG